MNARIIYTTKCNRNCKGCCNESLNFKELKSITDIEKLKEYETIILTGGEPLLDVRQFNIDAKWIESVTGKKVIVQSAWWPKVKVAGHSILFNIKGITYTLHDNPSLEDMIRLRMLIENLSESWHNRTARLNIDKRVYNTHDLSNLDLTVFDEVRKMEWKEECPLPENEELVLWK